MRIRTDRRHVLLAAAVSLLLFFATAVPGVAVSAHCGAPAGTTEPADEEVARLVGLINGTRSELALAPLTVNGELAAKARSWSHKMARDGVVSHSDVSVGGLSTEVAYAENVGCDASVESQHRAMLDSPVHYDNIVQAGFTHVGVGLARAPDGMLYTTELFTASTG